MTVFRAALLLILLAAPVAMVTTWGAAGGTVRPAAGPWEGPLAEREAAPFPRTFVNAAGEEVVLPAPPQRVVSGTVFSDAVLLEVCPPARIAALHHLSTDPRFSPVAEASARFPRHVGGDPEEILAARPDLVVASSFSRKEVRNLIGRDGCAVVRLLGFTSVEDVQSNIRALGWVLGLDAECETLVSGMQERLARVAAGKDRRRAWRVLHYAWGYTSGSGTTFDSLLQRVGARNVAAELGIEGSGSIRPEEVLVQDPDALVVGVEAPDDDVLARLRQMPGFGSLQAVRNERVVPVSSAVLASTSHHAAAVAEIVAAHLDEWGRP